MSAVPSRSSPPGTSPTSATPTGSRTSASTCRGRRKRPGSLAPPLCPSQELTPRRVSPGSSYASTAAPGAIRGSPAPRSSPPSPTLSPEACSPVQGRPRSPPLRPSTTPLPRSTTPLPRLWRIPPFLRRHQGQSHRPCPRGRPFSARQRRAARPGLARLPWPRQRVLHPVRPQLRRLPGVPARPQPPRHYGLGYLPEPPCPAALLGLNGTQSARWPPAPWTWPSATAPLALESTQPGQSLLVSACLRRPLYARNDCARG